MDGHRWKCFITNFLPKLKIFRFKMAIYFYNFDTVKEREPPFDEYFWSIIPKLDRVISLNIKLSTEKINQSYLQALFDQAPHLYSPSFNLNLSSNSKLLFFNNSNISIRRLNFKETNSFDQSYFCNHDQCIVLSRSSLGKQCEVLSIRVRHRRSILFLINRMIKLRVLNIRYQDNQHE
ncbi:unnamed protein product, partial [Rotaria sordida]